MLHIVLPVHNRARITEAFIGGLCAQTFRGWRLVLVDDGSNDDTVETVRRLVPTAQLEVLHGDGNLWWAGALQLAYEHLRTRCAPGDNVLLINDDVTLPPDFLQRGLSLLAAHPGACFQAVGLDRTSGHVVRGVVADLARLSFRATHTGEEPNCLATRGLVMTGEVFLRSGGFRPRWLPHYLSDYEFTLRLARQGVRLACDDSYQLDFDAATTGDNDYARAGVRQLVSQAFSNRAKYNPMHWSAFVLLTCPARHMLLHLLRIWIRFARALTSAMTTGFRRTQS